MRQLLALFLIAITLMSNGMVDFAVKVCHSTQKTSSSETILTKKSDSKIFSSNTSKKCCSSKKQVQEILDDEHPCCRSSNPQSIKCCTFLNLYYFTPKFHEEKSICVPSLMWKQLDYCIYTNFSTSKNISLISDEKNYFNQSDHPDFKRQEVSSRYCIWII